MSTTHANMSRRSSVIKASTLWMCWSMRDVDGWPGQLSSVTLVRHSLKHSLHSQIIRWCMVHAPYCANIRRWIFPDLTPSAHRICTTVHCFLMVQLLSAAAILLLSLLSAMWLNDGMLHVANYTLSLVHMWCCTSAPLTCLYGSISKLPLLPDSPTYIEMYK
jgi:hypothetical protein